MRVSNSFPALRHIRRSLNVCDTVQPWGSNSDTVSCVLAPKDLGCWGDCIRNFAFEKSPPKELYAASEDFMKLVQGPCGFNVSLSCAGLISCVGPGSSYFNSHARFWELGHSLTELPMNCFSVTQQMATGLKAPSWLVPPKPCQAIDCECGGGRLLTSFPVAQQ